MGDNRRKHTETAQRAPPTRREGIRLRQQELYKFPEQLIAKMLLPIINGDTLYLLPILFYTDGHNKICA